MRANYKVMEDEAKKKYNTKYALTWRYWTTRIYVLVGDQVLRLGHDLTEEDRFTLGTNYRSLGEGGADHARNLNDLSREFYDMINRCGDYAPTPQEMVEEAIEKVIEEFKRVMKEPSTPPQGICEACLSMRGRHDQARFVCPTRFRR